ncbi:chromatin assembly factor 1 subunit A, partial [Manacus vitellinus]|uniref:chromatin assembly factor 1 subunit A n=1 Tax=Manacus vitellinus TaxID=328815 RepID=UPI00115C798F
VAVVAVAARLPFKRLNPVPKEKYEVDPEVKKVKSSPSAFDPSKDPALDNVENDCQLGSNGNFPPKLVNGKGPLDHFIQKNPAGDTSDPGLGPELPKGSAHGLSDGTARDLDSGAASPPARGTTGQEVTQLSCPSLPPGCQPADSRETGTPRGEEGLAGLGCKDLAGSKGSQSELKAVLFEGKVPVVLLEDIMAGKGPQGASPGGSATSGNDTLESSPEGDSGLTNSSLSSASSPEVQLGAESKRNTSPLAASTPLRKDQERADKLQKLQAEREEKGRLKEEAKAAKERAKEEAKKRKEEEKELKEKERREKKEKEEKEKAEKLRVKEEKRKERQEALEAKLEEKRKKEEEKRLREEEKRINAQKAEITRFFQKPKTPQAPKILAGSCGKFAPFEIRENMVLAPLSRVPPDPDSLEQLDKLLPAQNGEVSFLRDLKCRKPRKSGPTWVRNSNDTVNSDVVVVDNCQRDGVPEREKFGRMKLLQFSENHRPAYWGTWNKSTTLIRARNPWAKDTKLLDYEVDSDEEWEEEEPGESLSHSEEDDEEEGEDEDEDDGFFVPHGYLSEDEGVTEECDPENQKVRQKLKAKEWDELIAKGKRFHVLQPVKIGCVWEGAERDSSANPDLKVLQQFTACVLDPPVAEEEQQIQKCSKKRARDQQILGHLLPLLHGNVHGSKVIIQEFQECCRQGLFHGVTEGTKGGIPAGKEEGGPAPGTAVPQSTPVPAKRRGLGSMNITRFMKRPREAGQAEAVEMDGFQADTEEDEEDDDCMIVDVQPAKDSPASECSGTRAAHQDTSRVSPPNTI